MITQRRQLNICESCGFRFIHSFYVSISMQKILKGNLQPKKEPVFGPLMHSVKCIQAEAVIRDHCTGTVKKKIDQCQLQ